MGKRDTIKKKSKSNPTKQADSLSELEALKLQVNTARRENTQLKKQNIELQKQLIQVRSQMIELQAQTQLKDIEKAEEELQGEWQGYLTSLQSTYGLDLEKDQVNLQTGVITRAAENAAQPDPDQNVVDLEESN
jgi:hypothetical protein